MRFVLCAAIDSTYPWEHRYTYTWSDDTLAISPANYMYWYMSICQLGRFLTRDHDSTPVIGWLNPHSTISQRTPKC